MALKEMSCPGRAKCRPAFIHVAASLPAVHVGAESLPFMMIALLRKAFTESSFVCKVV